mgnify:CR=1 FL=1
MENPVPTDPRFLWRCMRAPTPAFCGAVCGHRTPLFVALKKKHRNQVSQGKPCAHRSPLFVALYAGQQLPIFLALHVGTEPRAFLCSQKEAHEPGS